MKKQVQILGHNYFIVSNNLPVPYYGHKWENKLFFNSHKTPPHGINDYYKLRAIITQIDRDRLFTNLPEAETLYPRPKSYSGKQPRPMNCVLILLKVVNIVAAGVNLGDRRTQTKLAQLIWWGASPEEVLVYKTLQFRVKQLHCVYFPGYSFKPRKHHNNSNSEFIVLTPTCYNRHGQKNKPRKSRKKNNALNQQDHQQFEAGQMTASGFSSGIINFNDNIINNNENESSSISLIHNDEFVQYDGSIFTSLPSIAVNICYSSN